VSNKQVPVRLTLPGQPQTSGVATVEEWDGLARVRRAVGLLCICWAAAGVSIFLPILHWVLVPGLLLAGPVLFVVRFTETATLQALEADCPRCQKAGVFSPGGRFKLPRNVTCDGCGNLLELGPGESAS
jgi:hypothetical protein